MKRTVARFFALALAVIPLATVARAQTRYALLETTHPATGAEVRIRLMSGVPFAAKELPAAERRDVRLQRLWRSGRVELEFADEGGAATSSWRRWPPPLIVSLRISPFWGCDRLPVSGPLSLQRA